MRGKQAQWGELLDSDELHAAILSLLGKLQSAALHPADFAAAYILLCMQCIFPHGFIGGKNSCKLVEAYAYPSSQVESGCGSVHTNFMVANLQLSDVEGLTLTPRDSARLGSSCGVVDVFRRFQLKCIPLFVNDCIVHWAHGLRPLVLMTGMPSAVKLMEMQAQGRRCVTFFCARDELGRKWADQYPPFDVKDTISK